MPMVTEALKANAEVCHGDELCREKFGIWLAEIGLPNRLLGVKEIEECGNVKDTGFVWIKHRRKNKDRRPTDRDCFRFENVVVSFDDEVTAYFEPNRIKNLTGVKAKEFLIWISLTEIHVSYSASATGLITFRTPAGFSKSFPLPVFGIGTSIGGQVLIKADNEKDRKKVAGQKSIRNVCSY